MTMKEVVFDFSDVGTALNLSLGDKSVEYPLEIDFFLEEYKLKITQLSPLDPPQIEITNKPDSIEVLAAMLKVASDKQKA